MSAQRAPQRPKIVAALAGQPNVGKSTVFNLLTGLSQHVGNWAGKTVERREGTLARDDAELRIIDLPGTYGLSAASEEERIARDFVIRDRPDVVVMVANAAALERNLYLLAELLTLRVPVVLGLNMMDVARGEGIEIDPSVLAAALRLPVVPLVASRNEGVDALVSAAIALARDPGTFRPARPEIGAPHREVLAQVRAALEAHVPRPYDAGWVALKLLEGDGEVTALARGWLPEAAWRPVAALLAQHEDAVLDIAGGRYEWIGRMVRAAVTRPRLGQISLTDRLDRIAVHPLWGLAVLFSVFALTFWLTFTLAAPVQAWLDTGVIAPVQRWIHGALAGAPAWLTGLLAEGIVGGAGRVVTFVPVLAVFFAVLALLEDTGYLARAAYVMDRFMHALGLHGKSFLPLFLGFGCNVPAVLGARVIESPGGRLLTILLAPLVPCSARLTVLAFLTPVFFGREAFAFATGLVALNLIALALVGVLLNRTLFRGQHAAFIMELPLYHAPSARSIGLFVWQHTGAFVRRAGTLILLVAVVIWAAAAFPGPTIDASYLARFGQWLEPLGGLMGLDWRLIAALLASFVAKENAIAALGVLYGGDASGGGLAATLAAHVPPAAGFAFLAVTMLFIPCVATVAAMRQETRSWRWTAFSAVLLLVLALAGGAAVYQGARWIGLGTSLA
ncbi:MAG TPA: ferrous iron transport protein B [Usitatibacter sp.]|nr:ferrous iron transport protein B [Usitatibacter sp.]